MTGELGAEYKSGSQRARVVTESWGEHNLYCPNCSSPTLSRLSHNTQASDFSCPQCKFWFQLKGQQQPIGSSIMDGAYASMMRAISTDAAPNYYFMHYDVVTWRVRNLLLVPHFAFPPSAIVKRPPLAATARRAGWVGCNFDLDRIPVDARIPIVSTIKTSGIGKGRAVSPLTAEKYVEMRPARDCGPCLNETVITPPEKVRESFRRAKTLKDVPERGWVLDVLNIVRRITGKRGPQETAGPTFTNADVYAFERELAQLHPENRHIRDKIRQQLQVLRDTGFLTQPERGVWRIK